MALDSSWRPLSGRRVGQVVEKVIPASVGDISVRDTEARKMLDILDLCGYTLSAPFPLTDYLEL